MTENQKNILEKLNAEYKDTTSALEYKNAYELLVATILAAQCTDVRVNIVTKELFKKYPDAKALAQATAQEIEPYIKTCGLYKNKAKNLELCAKRLVEEYGGEVPTSVEDLTSLAGVGRKTANVVRAFAFGIPAMPVDTHVGRVSQRIGFANCENPAIIEKELCAIIPEDKWNDAHHWLIWHGRRVCKARKPLCDSCVIKAYCPSCGKTE